MASLKLKILKAHLDRDTAMFLNMDPFVHVTWEGGEGKTGTCHDGGASPDWTETDHEIDCGDGEIIGMINIKIKDENMTSDKFVAQCNIVPHSLKQGKGIKNWYKILYDNET